VLARTREVQRRLACALGRTDVPLFPEFLHLVRKRNFVLARSVVPKFIWAGQDIPRKDLELGLTIFRKLKASHFPSAELDVFGCQRQYSEPGVHYHGWVEAIDWPAYTGSGVLILSSYREGLSAVLVEAISHGLACIATPVGAIPSFRLPNVILLTDSDHTDLSDAATDRIANQIREHLANENIILEDISFSESLAKFLVSKGVIGKKVSLSESVEKSENKGPTP
jgi:glycosyltransferase involved in cell wall biosynthesis